MNRKFLESAIIVNPRIGSSCDFAIIVNAESQIVRFMWITESAIQSESQNRTAESHSLAILRISQICDSAIHESQSRIFCDSESQ